MKIFIKTYGCQMNKLDSALVSGALRDSGFEIIENEKEADAVVINTCSVREHAEQRVISHLGNLKHTKESRPQLVVAVIGCMAQRMGSELLKNPAVDIVCGPGQITEIVELVKNAIENKSKSLSIAENIRKHAADEKGLDDFESQFDSDKEQPPSQAFMRVMRGCDKFCSYCIVPYVRGPEVSREPKVIIEQIKRLASDGIKQITLLGQAVNSYEYKDGEKTYCLADILEMANDVSGIEWIRFVTNYPQKKYFEQICHAMRDLPKVCPYLHMPAQSGSNKILKVMNRKYTVEEYLELLEKARSIVPDLAIAGDFIVGFPGETDEDFQQTAELVKKAKYKNCFVFKYSPRPGTAGEKRLKDDIPADVKSRRDVELLAVQEKISDRLSKEFLNKTVKVLVEGASKKSNRTNQKQQLVGRTSTDWIVVFDGDRNITGQFVEVKITRTSPLTLFGEVC